MKNIKLKKLIKEDIKKIEHYQIIIDLAMTEKLDYRDLESDLKDSFFYSKEFPGKVTGVFIKRK